MMFPSMLHLFFIFFGTGFGVLIVERIHNVVWVRTTCSLVHGYACLGGAFTGTRKKEAVCPNKPHYPPVRLHGTITRKTIILNLNILQINTSHHVIKLPVNFLFSVIYVVLNTATKPTTTSNDVQAICGATRPWFQWSSELSLGCT
jgi:hypothetical protein